MLKHPIDAVVRVVQGLVSRDTPALARPVVLMSGGVVTRVPDLRDTGR